MTAQEVVEAAAAPDHCRLCGRRPGQLQAIDTVASLRVVQRRATLLIRRSQFNQRPGADPGSAKQSEEAAERAVMVLAGADRRLRQLFAEPQPDDQSEDPGTTAPVTLRCLESSSLASLPATAERLIGTVSSATSEDWYQRRPHPLLRAAEVAWLAVHEAVHFLDDAELNLARESAALRSVPDGVPQPAMDLVGDTAAFTTKTSWAGRGRHPPVAPPYDGDEAS